MQDQLLACFSLKALPPSFRWHNLYHPPLKHSSLWKGEDQRAKGKTWCWHKLCIKSITFNDNHQEKRNIDNIESTTLLDGWIDMK